MKTYIDYCLVDENTMLQVAAKYSSDGDGSHNFCLTYSDTKERSVTIKERLCNWLILKLGGRLREVYTQEYLPCLHLPPIEFEKCDSSPFGGVIEVYNGTVNEL